MASRTVLPLRDRLGSLTSGTLAWLYAAILLIPFYYFISSSFKTNEEIFESPLALPTSWDLSNFATAFRQADLGLAIANSALTTISALVLTLLLALPAAFALARAQGRLGKVIENVFNLGFLIPAFAAGLPGVTVSTRTPRSTGRLSAASDRSIVTPPTPR